MSNTKIALVTGGNRGLGRADAIALANTGVDVILTYRSGQDEAEEVVADIVAKGRRAVALQLDTSVVGSFSDFAEQVRQTLSTHWNRDTFDILVNNAGYPHVAPFAETTEQQFDDMVDVHLKGVFFLTQGLLPLLADGGSIVNLSSGLTRFVAEGNAAYAAVKGAVEVLTRYQAKELGGRGIRVNSVAPGPTATAFGGGFMQSEEFKAASAAQVALGRAGEPEDIGEAVASLVSDSNRWVTAQRIELSGGALL